MTLFCFAAAGLLGMAGTLPSLDRPGLDQPYTVRRLWRRLYRALAFLAAGCPRRVPIYGIFTDAALCLAGAAVMLLAPR